MAKKPVPHAKPTPPPPKAMPSTNAAPSLTLQVAQDQSYAELRRSNQEPLELALTLPEGDSWKSARVGRAVLRQPDGSQVNLALPKWMKQLRQGGDLEALPLPPLQAGSSLIIVSAGSGEGQGGADDMANNHRFSKIIVEQSNAQGLIPPNHGDIMQKTGQPLEIRPLRLPSALQVGDQMSIKVYEDQSHRGGARVEVHHPNAEIQFIETAPNGVAYFDVRSLGLHHLRYESTVGPHEASAELTFSTSLSPSN